jgi:hypothetical protein
MKHPESLRQLLHAMSDFKTAYIELSNKAFEYELNNEASVNDLPGFTENYPFHDSLNDMTICDWVDTTIERIRHRTFKVLDYDYLNTGGNTMDGIFEVWLPAELKTVFVYVNEEGYSMSAVDYIRKELEINDYDEVMIDAGDWGRVTGNETYFELYRHCLNEYTKSDCRHFGYVRGIPYFLLSDELQKQVDADYLVWLESNEYDAIDTDGTKIIIHPDYAADIDSQKRLLEVQEFAMWHNEVSEDYDVRESMYDKDYVLTLADRTVRIPFNADTWDAVDNLLKLTIREW